PASTYRTIFPCSTSASSQRCSAPQTGRHLAAPAVRGISRLLLSAVPWCQSSQRSHHTPGTSLKYIPRRAVLYVPGNDERKLRKLTSLDVDCAVLDCEDGVALNKK
ncbi:hypothetical protein QQF64_033110, partial [Cirrhinus molitorella]